MTLACLAVNASYEPLTLMPLHRALRLIVDGKAEVLEADGARVMRSASVALPRPAVIRLVKYVHVPRNFRRTVTNTWLFARDGMRCSYCGRHERELRDREFLTRDHVHPLSRGGTNTWDNVTTACNTCNRKKGSRLCREIGMYPATAPHVPDFVELHWKVRKLTPLQAKWVARLFGEDEVERITQAMEPTSRRRRPA